MTVTVACTERWRSRRGPARHVADGFVHSRYTLHQCTEPLGHSERHLCLCGASKSTRWGR